MDNGGVFSFRWLSQGSDTPRPTLRQLRISVRFLSVYGEPTEPDRYLADGEPVERACYLARDTDIAGKTGRERVSVCVNPITHFHRSVRSPRRTSMPLNSARLSIKTSDLRIFHHSDITSHALPETGCYVMRDSWEPEAPIPVFRYASI